MRRTIRGCGESGAHMRQLLEVCTVMTTEARGAVGQHKRQNPLLLGKALL